MTNQEAIKCVKLIHCNGCEFKDETECKHCFYGMSIEALKMENILDQIRWERNIAIAQLEEIGLSLGEKTDKVREAVDKSTSNQRVTNADRIRSMTDEELAVSWPCPYDTAGENLMPCILDNDVMGNPTEEYCRECMMEWLKKETK